MLRKNSSNEKLESEIEKTILVQNNMAMSGGGGCKVPAQIWINLLFI